MHGRLSAWPSQNSHIPGGNLLCKGERIKQVGTFRYLGFRITPNARCDTEIKKRIALSTDKFTKMKFILTNRNNYQNLHQNQHSESLHNYGPFFCMNVNAGHLQKT